MKIYRCQDDWRQALHEVELMANLGEYHENIVNLQGITFKDKKEIGQEVI